MRSKLAIENRLGNGFVSTYLRRPGLRITTADINPVLEPYICATLDVVYGHIALPTDLLICCKVLE